MTLTSFVSSFNKNNHLFVKNHLMAVEASVQLSKKTFGIQIFRGTLCYLVKHWGSTNILVNKRKG